MMPNYADIFSIVANQVLVKRWKLLLKTRKYRKTNYLEENENFTTTVIITYAYSAVKAHLYRNFRKYI